MASTARTLRSLRRSCATTSTTRGPPSYSTTSSTPPPGLLLEPVDLSGLGDVPRTYVRLTRDQTYPPELQAKAVAAIAPAEEIELDAGPHGHDRPAANVRGSAQPARLIVGDYLQRHVSYAGHLHPHGDQRTRIRSADQIHMRSVSSP